MFSEDRAAGSRMVLSAFGVELPFRFCPRGSCVMGSPACEVGRTENETQRLVSFERGFWTLETPVTQRIYAAVAGNNPSAFVGDDLPVETVSFFDCLDFCDRLNAGSVAPHGTFQLPTEARWEYACRAGTTTPFYCGERLTKKDANFDFGSDDLAVPLMKTNPVGSFPANPWGLLDLYGNVWERCLDVFEVTSNADMSSQRLENTEYRVLRGGSWHSTELRCRSAFRHKDPVEHKHSYLGFRIVLTPSD